MRQRRKARVLGPYKHRQQWRIVMVDERGERSYRLYETEEEALALIAAVRAELGPGAPGTTSDLIDRYETWMRDAKQNRASSIDTTVLRLRRFFGPLLLTRDPRGISVARCQGRYDELCREVAVDTTVLRLRRFFGPQLLTRDPRGISVARCQGRYDELCREVAVDTHQNLLSQTKTFCAWAVKRKWLARNPVRDIEPIGKKKKGKEQLRLDEARAFTAAALGEADSGNDAGVAVLCALVLGMRASEVVGRLAEDVDDGGRLLWITHSKTEAGRRTLVVPDFLRGRLATLAGRRKAKEPLFRSTDRAWVRDWTRRVCELAGVRRVTCHGLRGTHATLAMEAGTSTVDVAASLGHAGTGIVMGVYAKPGSGASQSAERLLQVLQGGKTGVGR